MLKHISHSNLVYIANTELNIIKANTLDKLKSEIRESIYRHKSQVLVILGNQKDIPLMCNSSL
jgi:hypothetical protein